MQRTGVQVFLMLILVAGLSLTAFAAESSFSVDALLEQGREVFYDDFELDWPGEPPLSWKVASDPNPFVVVERPELADGLILHAQMTIAEEEFDRRLQAVIPVPLDVSSIVVDFEYYLVPVSAYDLSEEVKNSIRPQFNFDLMGVGWPPKLTLVFNTGDIYNIEPPDNRGVYVTRGMETGCWQRATIIVDLQAETVQLAINGELLDYVGPIRSSIAGIKEGSLNLYWKTNFTDWYLRYIRVVAID